MPGIPNHPHRGTVPGTPLLYAPACPLASLLLPALLRTLLVRSEWTTTPLLRGLLIPQPSQDNHPNPKSFGDLWVSLKEARLALSTACCNCQKWGFTVILFGFYRQDAVILVQFFGCFIKGAFQIVCWHSTVNFFLEFWQTSSDIISQQPLNGI